MRTSEALFVTRIRLSEHMGTEEMGVLSEPVEMGDQRTDRGDLEKRKGDKRAEGGQ